ncbi:hypothetical protein HY464_00125 [Candidatus Peregrinibacteria bacterium]|nr:hypothetical protein [Candidatus Peregrinibacteria bacterium]MBI4129078.1 hypothetical protein [Candidatus Peregrinibacteria bacterium]
MSWHKKGGDVFATIEEHGTKRIEHVRRRVAQTMELLLMGAALFLFVQLLFGQGILWHEPTSTDLLTVFVVAGACHTLAKNDVKLLKGFWKNVEGWLRKGIRLIEIVLFGYGAFWFFRMTIIDRTIPMEAGLAGLLGLLAMAIVCHSTAKEEEESSSAQATESRKDGNK